jgi:predicted regulator of Ras-like GTPase activity (Roadblock/LC7/MglB family)
VQKILAQLNETPGIHGSLVVTDDGMVVAAALGPDLDDDTVGALAANMIRLSKNSMHAIGETAVKRYVLTSSHGRMVNQNIDVNHQLVELSSAGNMIVHRIA